MNDLGPIFPGMVFQCSGNDEWIVHVDEVNFNGVNGDFITFDELIPIPLTPEILRGWFGFELAGYSASYKIKGRVTVFVYNSDIHCWKIVIGGKGFEIKYVHQLQHWLASPGLGLNYKVDLTKTK